MQESRHGSRWSLVVVLLGILGLVAAVPMLSRDAGAGSDKTTSSQVAPVAVSLDISATLQPHGVPNEDILPSGARRAHAQPPLIESLRAAQVLVAAGLLPPPDHPPLAEILLSIDALAKVGALPHPSVFEVLSAVRALADAGALPPPAPVAPPRQAAARPAPVTPAAATPPPPARATAPPAGSGWYDDAYTQRIRDLVNQQRARFGLSPVSVEPRLAAAAGTYARVLLDAHWFAHVGPDGSTLVSRVQAAGFPFNVQIGEIIAWGTQKWSADALVQAWMNSPSHREEILSPVFTRAGASCYFSAAEGVTVYCVMDFAG